MHVQTRATGPGPRLAKFRECGDSRLPCGVVCKVSEGNHLHDYLRRATRHNPFSETQENVNHVYRYPLRPFSPSSAALQTAIRTKADGSPGTHPPPAVYTAHATRIERAAPKRAVRCPRTGMHCGAGRGAGPRACSRLARLEGKWLGDFLP